MMLSSRYLHLHEALGLGPMWLNKDAVFRPSETAPVKSKDAVPPSAAKQVAQAVQAAASGRRARMAAMAAVGSQTEAPPAAAPFQAEGPPETAPVAEMRAESAPPAAPMPAAVFSDGLPRIETSVRPSEIMVISICPSTEDCLAGHLFSGAAGVLLDKMLAAVGLQAHQAYKTSWIKTAPISGGRPDNARISGELPHVRTELAQSQAKAVLFLGQDFEKPELAKDMAQLCGGLPFFVIPHPARLLRQPQFKARAWAELKKLKRLLGR
ncbi:MAG: uracil-DNA glycosylase family protein [Neisseria sp.]|uniref:uracil-DNA glycosylase family protein n=1 Tax=Neisseria sp. TaxID=192066 RepID=UPI0036071755